MSTRTEEIVQRTEQLLLPILDAHRFELVDLEYVKEAGCWYLRAYIDKEGGITVDDCETASRALEVQLDREDFIEDSYVLEVSSPGLDRPLKKERDFARAIGKQVDLHLYQAKEGEKRFSGILLSYDDASVTIQDNEETRSFSRSDISQIRLAIDF